jgi:MFS family permease
MVEYIYIVGLLTGLGGFCFGYDIGVLSGILVAPSFRTLLGFTDSNAALLEGFIATALQFGAAPGILIQSMINDRYGRKNAIILSCAVFLVGTLIQTFCYDFWSMLAGRMVSGFGVGILVISVNMFNSEIAPKQIRGRIVGIQQFMVGAGVAGAYWMNYFFARLYPDSSAKILAME